MPRVSGTIAAPNIHFFMLPINPPFQRSILRSSFGFFSVEAWLLPPPKLALHILCKPRESERLRRRGANRVAQLLREIGFMAPAIRGGKTPNRALRGILKSE